MGNIDLLEDACAKLPHTTRKMFGGHGLFAPNGGMFAGIVDDDQIVFKLADEAARNELIALGSKPWVYEGGGKPMTMKEWILAPDDLYDDPRLMAEWAARAHKLVPARKPTRKTTKKPSATKTKRSRPTR